MGLTATRLSFKRGAIKLYPHCHSICNGKWEKMTLDGKFIKDVDYQATTKHRIFPEFRTRAM
ncbi:hypothetical protein HMPREF0645_1356 [Hallella bergensis DSM 17361]|uniref:Uncharacterized protein n=1 Tax=Hallella bergensis DSM 17361 TaxID=585502 RepID=D1PWM1_9BACT|nr:hypothetical protein HMPREF0645_1356 [Hallella bergensis DSM 17361]